MTNNVPVLSDAPTLKEARDYVEWMVGSDWGYSLGMDDPTALGYPRDIADALDRNEMALFRTFGVKEMTEVFWEMVDFVCDGRA